LANLGPIMGLNRRAELVAGTRPVLVDSGKQQLARRFPDRDVRQEYPWPDLGRRNQGPELTTPDEGENERGHHSEY